MKIKIEIVAKVASKAEKIFPWKPWMRATRGAQHVFPPFPEHVQKPENLQLDSSYRS